MSLAAKIVICLICFIAGCATGLKWEKGQEAQRQSAAKDKVIAGANAQADTDSKSGEVRAAAVVVYRDKAAKVVERIRYETVEKPVYRDCRITDGGMRNITELVGAANAAIGSDAAVPSPDSAR